MNNIDKMKELIKQLNEASDAYYNGKTELMTDQEFDSKIELLEQLEKITGIIMNDSPTRRVGYKILKELEEVKHTHLMLSQKKIHSINEIISFANGRDIYLSLKLDGMSMALSYDENGALKRSEGRGDGEKGNNCVHHLEQFINTPNKIVKSNYEIDGEAIIQTNDFNNYNQLLIEKATKEGKAKGLSGEELKKYIKNNSFANPRNLTAGTLNSLDNKLTKERRLRFIAWSVISGSDLDSYADRMKEAENYGFEIAPCIYMKQPILKKDLEENLEWFKQIAEERFLPYDGVVISYNSVSYAKSLGNTEKTPRGSVAYKYDDDTYPTKLKKVTYTLGKTGVLTPNAEFEPVIIDGTTVSKASLYNISCMKELGLTNGCTCYVKKCNLIIPAVESCKNDGYGEIEIVDKCPECNAPTEIRKDGVAEVLYCTNPNCKGKLLGKLSHVVNKNALNIDGLSEATIQKFINYGWLKSIKDIYHLSDHKTSIAKLEGFATKSTNKLLDNIEKSRNTTLQRLLYSLSIPLLGNTASKSIAKYCHDSVDEFIFITSNTVLEYASIDGIGTALVESLDNWWDEHTEEFFELLEELHIEKPEEKTITTSKVDLSGKSFVITGSLNHFSNRDELKALLESLGAKVSGSVSAKTFALICNDKDSNTGKSKKAKELGVNCWSEDDLLSFINS